MTRALGVRVAEHAVRSHRTNNLLTSPPYSSIREHASACDSHVSPWIIFPILGSCKNIFTYFRILSYFLTQTFLQK